MRVVAGLLMVLWVAIASAAPLSPADEARQLNREGSKLFAARRFPEALEKFRAAQERYPTPALWVNIGSVLRELGKNAEAIEAYERFLAEPTASADPRRPAVEAAIKKLAPMTGIIVVQVNEGGASVVVDGRRVEAVGAEVRFRVDPGNHTVVAELDGFAPATATISIAGGQEQSVALRLVAVKATGGKPDDIEPARVAPSLVVPESTPEPSANPRDRPRGTRWYSDTWGWMFVGGGVAIVAVGTGFLLRASSLDDDADAELDAIKKLDLRDQADSRRTTGYWVLGAGGATLLVGIIKLAWHDAPASTSSARTEVVFAPAWLGLRRTF